MKRFADNSLHRAVLLIALPALTLTLGAWEESCDRPEFVTCGVGDAVQVNVATQTIDPWPRYVKNRKLIYDGRRAGIAMRRYQANQTLRPRPLNPEKAQEIPLPDNSSLSAVPPPQPQ